MCRLKEMVGGMEESLAQGSFSLQESRERKRKMGSQRTGEREAMNEDGEKRGLSQFDFCKVLSGREKGLAWLVEAILFTKNPS